MQMARLFVVLVAIAFALCAVSAEESWSMEEDTPETPAAPAPATLAPAAPTAAPVGAPAGYVPATVIGTPTVNGLPVPTAAMTAKPVIINADGTEWNTVKVGTPTVVAVKPVEYEYFFSPKAAAKQQQDLPSLKSMLPPPPPPTPYPFGGEELQAKHLNTDELSLVRGEIRKLVTMIQGALKSRDFATAVYLHKGFTALSKRLAARNMLADSVARASKRVKTAFANFKKNALKKSTPAAPPKPSTPLPSSAPKATSPTAQKQSALVKEVADAKQKAEQAVKDAAASGSKEAKERAERLAVHARREARLTTAVTQAQLDLKLEQIYTDMHSMKSSLKQAAATSQQQLAKRLAAETAQLSAVLSNKIAVLSSGGAAVEGRVSKLDKLVVSLSASMDSVANKQKVLEVKVDRAHEKLAEMLKALELKASQEKSKDAAKSKTTAQNKGRLRAKLQALTKSVAKAVSTLGQQTMGNHAKITELAKQNTDILKQLATITAAQSAKQMKFRDALVESLSTVETNMQAMQDMDSNSDKLHHSMLSEIEQLKGKIAAVDAKVVSNNDLVSSVAVLKQHVEEIASGASVNDNDKDEEASVSEDVPMNVDLGEDL